MSTELPSVTFDAEFLKTTYLSSDEEIAGAEHVANLMPFTFENSLKGDTHSLMLLMCRTYMHGVRDAELVEAKRRVKGAA